MTDFLLDLGRNPLAKRLVRKMKLPVSLPESLHRSSAPWTEAELGGMTFAVGSGRGGTLASVLTAIVEGAGGALEATFSTSATLDGLLFDATGVTTVEALGSLYDFVKPRLKSLKPCAHVLLVGPAPATARQPEAAAAAAALKGFVKSLAKELGKYGSTAQLLTVGPDASSDWHMRHPVRFFLSRRSAFISGQCLDLGAQVAAPGQASDTLPLRGKVALVTGAAQGIGAEISRRLATEGARVIGLDRPQEKDALEMFMSAIGGVACALDLLDPASVKAMTKCVEADFGAIDILVNNAGITRDKSLARMPRDYWDDVFAVNLTAAIRLTEALVQGDSELLKLMNPGGRVVCMSSISGIAGNLGQTNYAAAKAGLIGFVESLAGRVASRGITVNALAPGFIETRITKQVPMAIREVARRFNSLHQGGMPQDVAEAVVFLAHPGAFAVTGQTLRVCGQNLIG